MTAAEQAPHPRAGPAQAASNQPVSSSVEIDKTPQFHWVDIDPLPPSPLYSNRRRASIPLIRWHLVRNEQDLIGSSNRAMRASLEKALASRANGKSPLIYAAGHDHSLQIMRGTVADYLLVSGLGSQSNAIAVDHGDDTVFAHEHPGFVALDFTDQEIWLSAIEPVASGEQVVLRVPVPSS